MALSEFGAGYVTCLFQFRNHAKRLDYYLDMYVRLMAPQYPDLFDEQRAIELWANGASDHLYELRRPPRIVPRVQVREAFAMAEQALDAGHGFRGTPYTAAQAHDWIETANRLVTDVEVILDRRVDSLEDAMEADRVLGLRPDSGTWACNEDIAK